MSSGWICLHRQILDNPMWTAEPFTRAQAWVDLLLNANHLPGHIRVRGIRVEIQRGQVAHSEETLANRWRWSRGKVRRFMGELEADGMAAIRRDNKISIVTILKYDEYQVTGNPDGTTKRTAKRTTDGQQTDTNNNGNNGNKKSKGFCADPSEAEGCAPPTPAVVSPIVIELPLNTGALFPITEVQLSELSPLYPAVNIRAELGKMKGWLIGNPSKRKTKSGIMKFITNWMSKAQDQGGSSPILATPGRATSPARAMADIRGQMVVELRERRNGSGDTGSSARGIGEGLRGIPAGPAEPGRTPGGLGALDRGLRGPGGPGAGQGHGSAQEGEQVLPDCG